MITYIFRRKSLGSSWIDVYLDKIRVGKIRTVQEGYCYFPIGHDKGGEIFKTEEEVKKSLEREDEWKPFSWFIITRKLQRCN